MQTFLDTSVMTPREVVAARLDELGMTRAELAQLMGGKSRVSEFLNGKRELSIKQVRALRDRLGIPADHLI
ncbi:MAG TPA: helix-turn-helix domain-containing protein [Longimicrobiaceae bacterium]|nr:helix-turn-helix domain-containing protein [Longimicrobiaceae bacterium]